MHIVFLKDFMREGRGAEAAVADTASLLAGAGHAVTLATFQDAATGLSFPPAPGVALLRTSAADVFDDLNNLLPDAVICAGTNETVALYAGLRRRGYEKFPWPVVHQCHTDPSAMFKWRHPVRNARIREALAAVDAVQVLVPSSVEPFRMEARFGSTRAIIAIGNALPARAAAGAPPSKEKLVLYPAAINKSKRPELAVRAFGLLAADFPEWRLAICGTGKGSARAALAKLAARSAPAGRIELPGYVKNLPDYYARAAFVAFPSASEGLPMTIIEAMDNRLPVIGCRGAPGVDGLVKNGLNGLLAKPDPHQFASAMRAMMEDPVLRARLGDGAHDFVNARYSRGTVLAQWVELLESL